MHYLAAAQGVGVDQSSASALHDLAYRVHRDRRRIGEVRPQHDTEEQVDRIVGNSAPDPDKASEDHVKNRKKKQRLGERPRVAEHRSLILKLEVSKRQLTNQIPELKKRPEHLRGRFEARDFGHGSVNGYNSSESRTARRGGAVGGPGWRRSPM